MAWVFFNAIALWWWEFRLSQVTHWTFALYLFVIAYASMFVQAALLFATGSEHLRPPGTKYLVRNAIFLALCVVAARTRNLKFHGPFAAGRLACEVIYI